MGCFNVACGISNISIGAGQDIAFLPLANKGIYKNGAEPEYDKLVLPDSSLIYPHCYFEPVGLPIIGKYNDYGTLEHIVKNDNTEALEVYFGVSIEDFVEALTSFRQYEKPKKGKDKFTKLLPRLTGMFIHGDVYDHLTNFQDQDDRIEWLHHADEDYLETLTNYAQRIKDMEAAAKERKEFVKLMEADASTKGPEFEKSLERLREIDLKIQINLFSRMDSDLDRYHRDWFRFEEIYGPALVKGLLIEELVKYRNFYGNMYSANRFYFPTMNGEQHGNDEASLLLLNKSVEILEKRIKQRKLDNGEWDEED